MTTINISKEINVLHQKKNNFLVLIKEIDNKIKAYQTICEHVWQNDGYDSHHTYAKCSICGKKETDIVCYKDNNYDLPI